VLARKPCAYVSTRFQRLLIKIIHGVPGNFKPNLSKRPCQDYAQFGDLSTVKLTNKPKHRSVR